MTDEPIAYRINRLHEHAPWSRSKTYELVRDGRLPARRLDGATFILRKDLEVFLRTLPAVVEPPRFESLLVNELGEEIEF